MKSIQKITILCAILMATYQTSYTFQRSSNIGSGFNENRSGESASRSGMNESASHSGSGSSGAKGGIALASHGKNQKPQGAAGLAAAGMMASKNSQDDDGDNDSGSSEAPTTPTTPTTPATNTPEQQAATPAPDTSFATSANMNTGANPQLVQNDEDTKNKQTPAEEKKEEEKDQADEDTKTLVPDQDAILEKLKSIGLIDSKSKNLLSMASMDQLFNNFVYFKNFIVENFPKDKIMSLAKEFINQIYPQEHVAAISLTPNAPEQPSVDQNSIQQPTTDNSHEIDAQHTTDVQDAMPAQQDNNMMDDAPAQQTDNSSISSEHDTAMQVSPSDEQVDQNYPAPADQPTENDEANQDNPSEN